jgi:hypothetical protein
METQLNPDDVGKILVAAWHNVPARGYMEELEKQWLWAGEVKLNAHDFNPFSGRFIISSHIYKGEFPLPPAGI